MFDINRHIATLDDLANLVKYLRYTRKCVFHPDDDFSEYINTETNAPTFSKDEADALNTRMSECFDLCESENIDIYDYMYSLCQVNAQLN